MTPIRICLVWSVIGLLGQSLADEIEPQVIFDGLRHPCGVAVQPQTGHVFVAESGAGRVVRIVDGQLEEVVVGFPVLELEMDAKLSVGPLGISFLAGNTLVIGGGGNALADDVICVVQVPKVGEPPCTLDDVVKLGPLPSTGSKVPAGDFFGVVATKSAIFATSASSSDLGWIATAAVRDIEKPDAAESFGRLSHFVSSRRAASVGGPAGITVSPRGEVVVSQMGRLDKTRDSRLAFYRSSDGEVLLNLGTDLHDIVSVCYGATKAPTNKALLYALDLAWSLPDEGGLFRLDAAFNGAMPSVRPTKLASLDRPTSMAIADNGSLYVTVLGAVDEDGAKNGKLLEFAAGL